MEFCKGSVVRSKAGRDKGLVCVIMELSADIAYIADGSKHKIASPKKKKLRHLQGFNTVLNLGADVSDAKVRKALAEYKS